MDRPDDVVALDRVGPELEVAVETELMLLLVVVMIVLLLLLRRSNRFPSVVPILYLIRQRD